MTLTLTDGGLGDSDGIANGTIVDPGGPAILANQSESSSSSPTIYQRQPSLITVKYVSVQQVVQAGQPVIIVTNIANEGEDSGNYTAVLKINGQAEQEKTGTLAGRTGIPVEFTILKKKPGTYTIDINGQQAIFNVIEGKANSSGAAPSATLYILIASLVVLALSAMIIARIRRRY